MANQQQGQGDQRKGQGKDQGKGQQGDRRQGQQDQRGGSGGSKRQDNRE